VTPERVERIAPLVVALGDELSRQLGYESELGARSATST
jgi:hypothetical protein